MTSKSVASCFTQLKPPRMCVLSTLCGNVDKHSPFDIYIERERKRKSEKERDRQKDRQTEVDRMRDRQTDRDRDINRQRQRDKDKRQTHRQTRDRKQKERWRQITQLQCVKYSDIIWFIHVWSQKCLTGDDGDMALLSQQIYDHICNIY